MAENLVKVKEVTLNNNCPVCYAKGSLLITFMQKVIETKFHKSITQEIKHDINCKTCNSIIYPVQWTDDIERVVDYQKKAFKPMATSTYIKKTAWIVIAFIALIAIAISTAIVLI